MTQFRCLFALGPLTASALFVAIATAPAVEAPTAIAPHQVIQLPERPGYKDAPVVTSVALSPRDELVATAGDDHLVWLWSTANGQMIRKLRGHDDWVRTLAFHPSGEFLASAGDDGRILVWNVSSGSIVFRIGGRDVRRGELVPVPNIPAQHDADCIYRVLYSPDGKRLVAAGFQGSIRIYSADTGQLERTLECPVVDMRAMAFSPDGTLLAAGGRNGQARIWKASTGQVVRDLQAGPQRIRTMAFSADGQQIAAAGDGPYLRVWEVSSGAERHAFVVRPGRVLSLVFCGPNELATGSSDNLIRIWKLDTEQEAYRLAGHEGSVSALVLNVAESTLVSGSFDTTVRFWRLPGGPAASTAKKPAGKIRNQ